MQDIHPSEATDSVAEGTRGHMRSKPLNIVIPLPSNDVTAVIRIDIPYRLTEDEWNYFWSVFELMRRGIIEPRISLPIPSDDEASS